MKRHFVLAACLVTVGAGVAMAQNVATYDPTQLPETKGTVAEYSLTPRGDVDGLILKDGTEVYMPPQLGAQLVFIAKPGDAVTIRGLHAMAMPMVQATSVSNDVTGKTVIDSGQGGPPGAGRLEQPLTASGHIKTFLHGPRGDLNGLLLEDGTIVRMPPPEATRLATQLTVGALLVVQGEGYEGELGRVINAAAVGPTEAQMTQITAPPHGRRMPPPPPGGPGMAPPPPPPG